MLNSKDFTKKELDDILNQYELMRLRAKTCRPIALPENLTADEFNWLLNYLKGQRAKFMETPPVEVDPLKVLDLTL